MVNAFATQEDTDYKGKVIQRLQNVTTLLKHLESCLAGEAAKLNIVLKISASERFSHQSKFVYSFAAAPRFQPPMTNFDVDSKFSAPIVTVVATKKGGGKGCVLQPAWKHHNDLLLTILTECVLRLVKSQQAECCIYHWLIREYCCFDWRCVGSILQEEKKVGRIRRGHSNARGET